jgi:hypothetical protein
MPKIIQIPFAGFYESIFTQSLDILEERKSEYYEEQQKEDGIPEHQWLDGHELCEVRSDALSYRKAHDYIARQYAESFNLFLATEPMLRDEGGAPIDPGLTFESMISPRFYNFETDRIFCHIPDSTVALMFALSAEDKHATLAAEISERCTSRSGFCSFYDNTLESWLDKPLDEWDHNELKILLSACMLISGIENPQEKHYESIEWRILSDMEESDDFTQALDTATDWPAYHAKVESIRANKERAFCEMNGLEVAPEFGSCNHPNQLNLSL